MNLPRLQLDYHAPPRRGRVLGLAVLAVSLAAAGLLVERYREVRGEIARVEAAQTLLPGERRAARAIPRERLDEEMKAAEAVLRQLALPWAAMVRAVERAASPEVALLQVQPEARERQLRVTAEAKSQAAMLQYLRRLAAAEALAEVHLASHQVVLEDPQRPIQFTVLARLKGSP